MQRVKSNEPTNPSNEQRSSIREEMQKFGLDQHTCSVKQTGYETEAQLLVTALNFFDYLNIPVQLVWNTGWLRRDGLSLDEAGTIFDKTGIAHLVQSNSETEIQSREGEEVIYTLIADQGESMLARSVYVPNTTASTVKLYIDFDAVEKLIAEQNVTIRTEKDAVVLLIAAPHLKVAASRASAELEESGIASRTIYTNESNNEFTLKYAIRIEPYQTNDDLTETGLIPITLIDHAQRIESKLVLNHGIHVLTQLLL
ncbi:hypothetical protein [Paenibacillus sp. 453mf]|uniref:hypothetical protein n=1 Tax=Paenibacillus sp. 453mf TaxID=1761874 RepID=UPI0008E60ABC|nr:hypothetical protein [Paenibacillus sp. 453mf]SFS50875.1 hypothetical protein SAMN04488601_1011242 [Paenibacillus sp. 453mf]